MRYDIYIIRTAENGVKAYDKECEFDDLEKAQKKAEKLQHRYKKATVKVCPIPKYGVGYKIYMNGKYYKTIVDETDNFWIVNNEEKEKTGNELLDNDYFLKDGFEIRFVKGDFDAIEEELDGE